MKILLIRHGETANADRRCYNGHYDADLSENGVRQIETLAERLNNEPIKAVYSSDLKRSRKSAQIFARRHSLEVYSKMELREIRYGRWEGLPYSEIKKKFPDEISDRSANFVHYRIKGGGENLADLSHRVVPAVKNIIARHRDETIAMLLHGGVNRVILGWALNIDLKYLHRLKQNFAALNIISFYDNNEAIVELVNN